MTVTIEPLLPRDREQVVRLIKMQTNFLACEVDIAIEVIDATFNPKEDYRVLAAFAEDRRLYGFISFGPIPLTENRYDLYWIAVDPGVGRHGVGTQLLKEMEARLAKQGPCHIYVDTSSTEGYLPAREFYEKNDYSIVADLKDFYRQGDDKIIFRKII